jgi:GTP pyrophosphokinase
MSEKENGPVKRFNASRGHSLKSLPPGRRHFASETRGILAPLAKRLGEWESELEDLGLRNHDSDAYGRIASLIPERRPEREQSIERHIEILRQELQEQGIEAEFTGRPKHIYSIYSKMLRKNVPLSQIYDVRAVRATTATIPDCYRILGIVHDLWQPIPGEFDDHIATPKENMYRSLHTAVIGQDGEALEVQIRTHEMHRRAEHGSAAHWRYKEGGGRDDAFEAKSARYVFAGLAAVVC